MPQTAIVTGAGKYLFDLPARDMIEYGHVLPERGNEAQWFEALPKQDRARGRNDLRASLSLSCRTWRS